LTIFSTKSKGIGLSNGNWTVPFDDLYPECIASSASGADSLIARLSSPKISRAFIGNAAIFSSMVLNYFLALAIFFTSV
jgi:hypothetical protein